MIIKVENCVLMVRAIHNFRYDKIMACNITEQKAVLSEEEIQ